MQIRLNSQWGKKQPFILEQGKDLEETASNQTFKKTQRKFDKEKNQEL